FGLLPERGELVDQSEAAAREQEIDIGAAYLGFGLEARAHEVELGFAHVEAGDLAAQIALARPGERLRRHDRHEARVHAADLDARETVVLDPDRERGIRERAGPGRALAFGADDRAGTRELGAPREALFDQTGEHGIAHRRSRSQRD